MAYGHPPNPTNPDTLEIYCHAGGCGAITLPVALVHRRPTPEPRSRDSGLSSDRDPMADLAGVRKGVAWQSFVHRFYINWIPDCFRRLASEDDYSLRRKLALAMLNDVPGSLLLTFLRRGIPLVGLEFDEMFLPTTAVNLEDVGEARLVLKKMITPWQYPWLRHLSFLLDSRDDSWLRSLRGRPSPKSDNGYARSGPLSASHAIRAIQRDH